jgi:S-methylmethionine-dependent homocysteine/selenocysteine methylase
MPARLILLDGGTGRELARTGAPFRQPEWSALALIEAPIFVTRVHEAYVRAGADVITTNSYAIVPFHIGEERFRREGVRLAGLAGRLASEVAHGASREVRVAGSLPPSCGSYRPERFSRRSGRPILETLVEGLRPHVDHWQAETLSAIEEAQLVREILGDDERPLWVSYTLQDEGARPGDARLRSGERVDEAVHAALGWRAAAVLFNCSQPEVMGDAIDAAVDAMRSARAPARIGVYANAFPPQPKDAEANAGLSDIRADLAPGNYLAWARDWRARGASVIGGCCGIGPEHIAVLDADRRAPDGGLA